MKSDPLTENFENSTSIRFMRSRIHVVNQFWWKSVIGKWPNRCVVYRTKNEHFSASTPSHWNDYGLRRKFYRVTLSWLTTYRQSFFQM